MYLQLVDGLRQVTRTKSRRAHVGKGDHGFGKHTDIRIGDPLSTASDQAGADRRDGKLVGVVSRSKLVQALASEPAAAQHDEQVDRTIKLAILARLGEQSWTGFGARNIVVANGVVHVWGLVASPEERQALHALVESVPACRAVPMK